MPVHRDREKKESTAEEMEVDEQENEASSSEEEDSDTSSVSEDGDSSGEKVGTSWKWAHHSLYDHINGNHIKNMLYTSAALLL